MIDKKVLLNQLKTATDKAARLAIDREVPISDKKDGIWVGKALIRKQNDEYNIYSLDKKVLYSGITVFDVATIIAQRHFAGEFKIIEKVRNLEKTFSKHHTDMLHYLHCIKAARGRKDYMTVAILEDKFQLAEMRAKRVRNDISIFKKLK